MKFEKKRILITVKAYPNPSKKYGETVCCAGIDLSNFQLIRLYPIPFRDLDSDQKFKKYCIVEADCSPASDDKRPESFRVKSDSIKVKDWLDAGDAGEKRKSIVLKLPIKSLCQVYKDADDKDLSLGLIKPNVISFYWEKQPISDQGFREKCYAQLSLFIRKKDPIEKIPFNFYYKFKCEGISSCPGHKLLNIDWEINQAYRFWRTRYPKEEVLLANIKKKWLEIVDPAKRDAYFFVGNMQRFRKNFMVLGVFYPLLKH